MEVYFLTTKYAISHTKVSNNLLMQLQRICLSTATAILLLLKVIGLYSYDSF